MTGDRTRRDVLALAGAALMTSAMPLRAGSSDWKTRSPTEGGFAADLDRQLDALRASGRLGNLHGVVALRGGSIFFERYLTGIDEARGQPLGEVTFGPDTLHDLRSVTKSIVGLLYGIALTEGRVPAPDQKLMPQFPEYPDLAEDPKRARLTIAHALTMTLGTEWNERLSYRDPANSETAMDEAPDRFRFILERPIVAAPGQVWIYNGGAPALVARLIEKGTGKALHDFAQSALFAPLGIAASEWAKGKEGEAIAASGLRLTPRDLARIGQMVLSGGTWGGRRVVSSQWLDASFRPAAMVRDGEHYGYLWRIGELAFNYRSGTRGARYVSAVGNGGQRLFLLPDLDVVVAITAGNYNSPNDWEVPNAVLRQLLLPSLSA
jgi:CubicO group peptidase (beta-lactamase class C family)